MSELVDLEARIARMEDVLSKIAEGDLNQSIKVSDTTEDAFTTLEIGVNFMVSDLRRSAQARAEYESQLLKQSRELEEKLETIQAQKVAIAKLSVPIIEIWHNILCLPVIGTFDTKRSSEMTERLLASVVRNQARAVIIDITGIDVMDTHTANHFIQMAKSVKLLGTEAIITGISSEIAGTLARAGVEIQGVQTLRNPREALQILLAREQRKKAPAAPATKAG